MSFRFNQPGDSREYELSNGQSLDFNGGESLKLTNPDDIADMVPQGHDVLVMTKSGSSYLLKNFLLADDTELQLPDGTSITADNFVAHPEDANPDHANDHLRAVSIEPEDNGVSVALQSVTLLSIISQLSQNTSAFDEFQLNADGSENPELRSHFKSVTISLLGSNGESGEQARVAELATQEADHHSAHARANTFDDVEEDDSATTTGDDDDTNTTVTIDITDVIDTTTIVDITRVRITTTVTGDDDVVLDSDTTVDDDGTVTVIVDVEDGGGGDQVDVDIIVTDPEDDDKVIDRTELTVILPDPFNDENLTLTLSNSSVLENEDGVTIGSLNAIGIEDEIEGPFTYSIISDEHELFEIDGSTLKLKDGTSIDYESAPETYSLTLRIENDEGTQIDRTLSLSPADANDGPEITDINFEGSEDLAIPFERDAFEQAFTDEDRDDELSAIRIDTLPLNGTLFLNGESIVAGQSIESDSIDAISFVPNQDWNGQTTFAWSGSDGTAWSGQSKTVSLDVESINDAPVTTFSIGSQTANEDAAFTFDLPEGLFADVDTGDTLTLSADLPEWLNFDPESGKITGVPSFENVGEHRIEISATDSHGESAITSFTLDIVNVNDRPTFTQIQDVSIGEYDDIDIDAGSHFTDEDLIFGDSLTFSGELSDGSALPEWISLDAETGKITGSPPQGRDSNLEIRVTATDQSGEEVSNTFALHVENQNDAPNLDSEIEDQTTDEDSEFSFNIASNFSDSDLGDTLSYTATLPDGSDLPDWLSFDSSTGQFSGVPENEDVGMLTIQVTASDGDKSVDDFFAIMVNNTNDGPVASAIVDQTATEDSGFSLDVSDAFSDVDVGDTLSYSATLLNGSELPDWLEFDEATGKFSGTPENEDVGELSILVVASDGEENANAIFSIEVENTNDGPVATYIPEQTTDEDAPFIFDVSDAFSDVDAGDELTFTASLEDGSELPEWLSFNAHTGEISGTPENGDVGSIKLKVSASDGDETASTTLSLTVENTNDGPFVTTSIEDIATDEDSPFELDVSSNFGDPDFFDALEFSATLSDGSPLPEWLEFDPFTATFTGTPENEDVGSIEVKVIADDGEASISDTFTIEVENTNDGPVVTSDFSPINTDEDAAFSYDTSSHFSDEDTGDSLTFSATLTDGSELPDWISIDPITGELSGIPENGDVGEISIKITATDESGESTSNTLKLSVENTNDGPVATPIEDQSIDEDSDFNLDAGAYFSDEDLGDTLSYSATLSNGDPLPDWLSFDAESGQLTGTPRNDDVGSIETTITASDGQVSAQSNVTLEIENTNDGPTVSSSIQNTTTPEDSAFELNVSDNFSDQDLGDTLYYSATLADDSPLPDWLTFDSETGTFTGTPENGDVGQLSIKVVASDGESEVSDEFTLTVNNTNDGPVVTTSIENQQTTEDASFHLDVSSNFDDEDLGDILTYSATLEDGSPLPDWISFNSETGEFSGTPQNDDVGSFELRVTASDGEESASQTFELEVENTNDAPVVTVQLPDVSTNEDAEFNLDASSAFEDIDAGDTLSYSATLEDGTPLPSWLNIDSETGVLSGTPENDDVGSISVTVTASDGQESVSNTFSIEVENTNDGPQAVAIENQTTAEDTVFTLDVSNRFSDEDEGAELSFEATQADGSALPAWLEFNSETGTFSGTPENDDVGLLSIEVTAIDESGSSVTETFSIEIENTNDGPVATTIDNQIASEDSAFSVDVSDSFSDEDLGDTLSYSANLESGEPLPSWLSFDSENGTFSGTPANADVGEIRVSVTASDGAESATESFKLTVENTNDTPTLQAEIADTNASEDSEFSLDISSNFEDVDLGDTLSYSATLENGEALPSWLSIDPDTGELSGTPQNGDVGTISITVTASDLEGETATDSFSIQVDNTNDGPTATVIEDQSTDEDSSFNLDTSEAFSDIDEGDTLTFSATLENGDPLPDWLSIDSETGELSGTPRNQDVGEISITVTSSDGEESASTNFQIAVENTNDGPTASDISNQTTDEDSAFSLDVSSNFNDIDLGDTLVYEATLEGGAPLPDWLSFDEDTGVFSGTPENDDVGEISVTVTASDGEEIVDSTFSIHVENTNDGPTATAITNQTTDEDAAFNLDVSSNFDDVDASDSLTFSATLENGDPLPDWLSIDEDTGELSGTPQNGDVGSISVTVTATDEPGEEASSTFGIQVDNTNDGPTATAISDQTTDEDAAFSLDVSGNFDDVDAGDSLTFSATLENGDPLPDWLSIDENTGELSGTPENGDLGSISVTVTATDESGEEASSTFGIQVDNTNDRPTATTIDDQTTDEDAVFSLDVSGNFNDVDAGDSLTFSATLENGDPLPDWLSIDENTGELSGTPENGDLGSISVTVTATDESGEEASSTFCIQVDNTNDGPTATAISDQTTDEDAAFSLDVSGNFDDVDAGDSLTFSATLENGDPLPDWLSIDTDTGELSGTPENGDVGSISVTVTATDESGEEASSTFGIQVDNTNDGPTATAISDQTTDEDTAFSLDVSGNFDDIDAGDSLSFSATLENGDPLPDWLSIDEETGELSGTPENGDVGSISVTVTATDESGEEASSTFGIQVENTNDGPTATAISDQTTDEDAAFSLDVSSNFDDIDAGDSLTFSATLENGDPLPSWLSIDQDTGELSGTPENGDVGSISLTVTATDESGEEASSTFGIQVNNTNDGPTATAISNQTTDEDAAFSLDVSSNFNDVDAGDSLTFSATLENGDPLPDWLSIDEDTGELSGTPENGDVGSISVTV
ncbi:putative Ig domain-containing protein, partial [Pelagicoccus mobilis]